MNLYVVNIEECYDGETEIRQRFFVDEDNARKAFAEEVRDAKKNLEEVGKVGEIMPNSVPDEQKNLDCPVYVYEETENCFEYWLDLEYFTEHTSVTFESEETED